MSEESWVHLAQTVVIALIFVGRWMQAREGGEVVTAEQLAKVKEAMREKADCDRVTRVERRLNNGDQALESLKVEQGRQDERLKGVATNVDRLNNKVFNGGSP